MNECIHGNYAASCSLCQQDDPNISDCTYVNQEAELTSDQIEARKDFGGARPTPPAYSLEELENAILQVLAYNQIVEEEGRHPGFQAVVELNRKLEAAARLLREWHSTLEQVKRESCQMGSDFGNQKIYDLVVDALAKVKP